MELLIDGFYCPGIIVDICMDAAKKADLNCRFIRKRDQNLYQQKSSDFDEEVRRNSSYEVLQPILESMEPGDILVTSDDDLATQAIHRVTAVIHPDGYIYTSEGINLTTIEEYIARIQGRQDTQARPLGSRDPELNEKFARLLYQYIGNIS